MATAPKLEPPRLAFGLTSFVLGMIGFLLFFLPILGAPVSVVGLFAGLAGCLVAGATTRGSMRWSIGGVVLCLLALAINVAVAYAPRYSPPPTGPPTVSVPDTPYVAPPALER